MYDIAHHITGDYSLSIEDSIQNLWLAVYDAISGFERQDNGKNGKVDDFIKTKGFDKYLKSTLWNCKNKVGASIKQKYAFQKNAYPIVNRADLHTKSMGGLRNQRGDNDIEDPKASWMSIGEEDFNDLAGSLDENQKVVLDAIVNHPECMMDNGKLNFKAIVNITGISPFKLNKIFYSLKDKVSVAYDY